MGLIVYFSDFGPKGDDALIPFGWDALVVAAWSSASIYYWAMQVALPNEEIEEMIGEVEAARGGAWRCRPTDADRSSVRLTSR